MIIKFNNRVNSMILNQQKTQKMIKMIILKSNHQNNIKKENLIIQIKKIILKI